MSAPFAFSSFKLDELPGTLTISPKVTIIVSSILDSATMWFISERGVTHTGQPGPEIR